MPSLTVKVRAGRAPAQKQALLRALKEALLEAFPKSGGWYIWLEEYGPDDCLLPEEEENAIVVQTFCFAGRSKMEKDALFRLSAEHLAAAGENPDSLVMVLSDPCLDNWGITGQSAAAFFSDD